MSSRPINRYFRTDVPLVVPEGDPRTLRPRTSGFWVHRTQDIEFQEEQSQQLLSREGVDRLRGNRSFAYHVMALMVKKEYGNIPRAMEDMIVVAAEWEHKPFIQEVDGEPTQVIPFTEKTQSFAGGFQSTPAELVDSTENEPEKVAFEWRTNLY